MRFVQFQWRGRVQWGEWLEDEEACLNFAAVSGAPDLRAYLNSAAPRPLTALRAAALARKQLAPRREMRRLAPVFPGAIFGVGCNFRGTFRNQKAPILFLKAPQAIAAHRATVRVPAALREVYAEVELGVVIGRRGALFGYTVVNDVTARDLDQEDVWFSRKSYATFAPVGPWIVTPDAIGDPTRLDLFLDVNGQRRLASNTSEMIFGVKEVVAALRRRLQLMPGDLIMMGCPGLAEKLRPGDVVRMEIAGIGVLENRMAWQRK
ncbi:MAG: fumarylacetoacetate hydrolase family protein [Verrucomicrobia bacterium]|nr:fumarylacetoacetate hydrolase family protein [Verrucomicrobiota bacterium]